MTTFNDFVLSSPSRERIIVDIDSDIATTVEDMSCYIEPNCRLDFTSKIYSLLLCAIVIEDSQESADGFERIMQFCHIDSNDKEDRLFGAFLAVLKFFMDRYSRRDDLIEELKDLISGSNESAEELFDIRVSRNGRYLLIG